MTAPVGKSLAEALDLAMGRLRLRLEGLTDAEYFWEPVEGCWTLHQGSDGSWFPDGAGAGGPEDSESSREAVTTIGWRVAHLAGLALRGLAERRFGGDSGGEELSLEIPGRAEDVDAFLVSCLAAWQTPAARLTDEEWWAPLGPAWGPNAEFNSVDLGLRVLDEVVHHGAEIGLLRDLYPRLTS